MKWLVFVLLSSTLFAHALLHESFKSDVYTVAFHFASEGDFSFESYEVYSPKNSDVPFAVGRTDAKGRVFFLPDTNGTWQVKAFSEDGHGAVVDVNVDATITRAAPAPSNDDMQTLLLRLVIGIAAIGAIFAMLHFFMKRKEHEVSK